MTRVAENAAERARIFSPKVHAPTLASKSKRKWFCFCPSETPAKPAKLAKSAKHDKTLQHKPATHRALAPPVSSGEAGSAPRVDPVPALGPLSEDRAFRASEDVFDFSHWR